MEPQLVVVDDEPLMLETIRHVLKRLDGIRVHTECAPAKALEWMCIRPTDLLITDFLMSEMNGLELALAVRRMHPRLPILFVTGEPAACLDIPGLYEPLGYLKKPFSPKMLLAAVRRLVGVGPA